jgi:hypothetical protein
MSNEREPVKAPVVAIDVNIDKVPATGVAYYTMPTDLKHFINDVYQKHGIIGFEFRPEEWELGIIVKDARVVGTNIKLIKDRP